MENVQLSRQVFDKVKFNETINTEFTQLVHPQIHLSLMLTWLPKKIFGYYTINSFI
jgi:hypothetical protein